MSGILRDGRGACAGVRCGHPNGTRRPSNGRAGAGGDGAAAVVNPHLRRLDHEARVIARDNPQPALHLKFGLHRRFITKALPQVTIRVWDVQSPGSPERGFCADRLLSVQERVSAQGPRGARPLPYSKRPGSSGVPPCRRRRIAGPRPRRSPRNISSGVGYSRSSEDGSG